MYICNIIGTFLESKFIPSIEIHKVSFREQSLVARYNNMKEMPQKIFTPAFA